MKIIDGKPEYKGALVSLGSRAVCCMQDACQSLKVLEFYIPIFQSLKFLEFDFLKHRA